MSGTIRFYLRCTVVVAIALCIGCSKRDDPEQRLRTLIGKDLKRRYEISGNRLTVKSTNPNEHWKVVWERY